MESLAGQLLVAAPTLGDPNFHRTVVLIASHVEDGAMGVVLNRPGDHTVGEAVPALADAVDPDSAVYVGGPVAPANVVVLAEFTDPEHAGVIIEGNLGFVSAGADLEALPGATTRARVFAGHAGWGPGQLESELEEEAWITAPYVRGDAFHDDPEELWAGVLRRKGGRYALLARMPEDPRVN